MTEELMDYIIKEISRLERYIQEKKPLLNHANWEIRNGAATKIDHDERQLKILKAAKTWHTIHHEILKIENDRDMWMNVCGSFMGGKPCVYKHIDGNEYVLLTDTDIKSDETGKWIPGVIYMPVGGGKFYTTSKIRFQEKFIQVI